MLNWYVWHQFVDLRRWLLKNPGYAQNPSMSAIALIAAIMLESARARAG
jgi:hypothetical protein